MSCSERCGISVSWAWVGIVLLTVGDGSSGSGSGSWLGSRATLCAVSGSRTAGAWERWLCFRVCSCRMVLMVAVLLFCWMWFNWVLLWFSCRSHCRSAIWLFCWVMDSCSCDMTLLCAISKSWRARVVCCCWVRAVESFCIPECCSLIWFWRLLSCLETYCWEGAMELSLRLWVELESVSSTALGMFHAFGLQLGTREGK